MHRSDKVDYTRLQSYSVNSSLPSALSAILSRTLWEFPDFWGIFFVNAYGSVPFSFSPNFLVPGLENILEDSDCYCSLHHPATHLFIPYHGFRKEHIQSCPHSRIMKKTPILQKSRNSLQHQDWEEVAKGKRKLKTYTGNISSR